MVALPSGQPVCGSCGVAFPERQHVGPMFVPVDGKLWPGKPQTSPYTAAEYATAARAAGWKVHAGVTYGGRHYDDALCTQCASPDPRLVALCGHLALVQPLEGGK